jgi:hypothetical protein
MSSGPDRPMTRKWRGCFRMDSDINNTKTKHKRAKFKNKKENTLIFHLKTKSFLSKK